MGAEHKPDENQLHLFEPHFYIQPVVREIVKLYLIETEPADGLDNIVPLFPHLPERPEAA